MGMTRTGERARSELLAAQVDPAKLKQIARAVLGVVALFIPGGVWARLLAAFLDAVVLTIEDNPRALPAFEAVSDAEDDERCVDALAAFDR